VARRASRAAGVTAPERESNWHQATEPHCPHCGESRQIERISVTRLLCITCAREWTEAPLGKERLTP